MPQSDQPRISFEEILQSASLPSPGPEYYAARRRLWLTPRVTPPTPPPSSAREKLEEILSHPNAVHSQEVWNSGLEKVWKGLSSGGRLKNRLPMALIIKIIYAAWLRDRTWPAGTEAPDSDEQQQETSMTVLPQTSASAQSSRIPVITSSEVMETTALWSRSNPIR